MRFDGIYNENSIWNGTLFFASFSTDAEIIRGEIWNGIGSIRYNDGVYKGQYRNGRFHGKGIFIANSGRVLEGMCKDGRFSSKRRKSGPTKRKIGNLEAETGPASSKSRKRIAAAL